MNGEYNNFSYITRRSPVICLNGAVASSQPLATAVGYEILRQGGNAADAAVALAACLNLVEPMSTGLGGDTFVLFYDALKKTVKGINGSGRSPAALTLDYAKQAIGNQEVDSLPPSSIHTVTVPGSAAAWVDCVEHFGSGKLSLAQLFQRTIEAAEDGFVVHPVCAHLWKKNVDTLTSWKLSESNDLLLDGRAPVAGEIMTNPNFGNTLKEIANHGKAGFYKGRIARAIVDVVQKNGGLLSLQDMENHQSTFDDPISTIYKGIRVWEIPPNGQGITVLMALNILKQFNLQELEHNSADYLHILIEALKLAFSDSFQYVADPAMVSVPVQELLNEEYGKKRSKLISSERALQHPPCGLQSGSDTVYFTVVDEQGNACSFINSIYFAFGSGLVPHGCGFALQNRGVGFSLTPGHMNVLAPGKRAYHTIIPGMATHDYNGELYCSFGVMGGHMQPQGHVQVLCNMIDFGMDPQEALDRPRFRIDVLSDQELWLENGISDDAVEELKKRGHKCHEKICEAERHRFGLGQIIQSRKTNKDRRVLWVGSEPRADGCGLGY